MSEDKAPYGKLSERLDDDEAMDLEWTAGTLRACKRCLRRDGRDIISLRRRI